MNTNELLRQLDAAPQSRLTDTEAARSEALLRSVLDDREPARAPRPSRGHATRNWVLAGAGALAVAAIGVATLHYAHFPTTAAPVAAGPLSAVDLASWTSTATVVPGTSPAAQSAEKWCIDSMSGGPGASSAPSITSVDQRGAIASMIVTRGGYTILCIAGSDSTGFWEVDGEPGDPVVSLAPTQITQVTRGGHGQGSDGFNYVEGLAGADVASVTLTENGHTMTAPVTNGRWTAWWPDAAATGELTGQLTITAKDGSTSIVSADSLQS